MRGAVPVALAALAALAAPSCAGLRFSSQRAGLEPDLPAAAGLRAGSSTLGDCLAVLGAPLAVEESESPGGGRVLTWEWTAVRGWGFFFSVPLSDWWSPSLNYDAAGTDPTRLRLIFGDDWVLRDFVLD